MRGSQRAGFVILALLGALAGCGGGASRVPRVEGSVDAWPSMEVLPSPDRAIESLSERMRFAYLLTEQSFELDPPLAPLRPTVAQLQEWSDGELSAWIERKNQLVEAARAELDLAAEESHRQRIMAGALVGLMYEDVARVILSVPVPAELLSDPEIAEVFRDIIDYQASTYLGHARNAYRACNRNAVRPQSMRHWAGFCSGRLDLLPSSRRLGSGDSTTRVEVIVE